MLQVRRPVDFLDVEHEYFSLLWTELLTQLSHIVVPEVPLVRAKILQALGGLVEFRLQADHHRPRAFEPGEDI